MDSKKRTTDKQVEEYAIDPGSHPGYVAPQPTFSFPAMMIENPYRSVRTSDARIYGAPRNVAPSQVHYFSAKLIDRLCR